MPMNQHDKILSTSVLNMISNTKYNDRNIQKKTRMSKVKENVGKVQEERKATTEINRRYSQIMPIAMGNLAKDDQNMAIKEKETKQKPRYDVYGFKNSKHKSPETRLGSQDDKDNMLLVSVVKRDAKSKTIESHNKSLEAKYDFTTVQKEIITKIQSNSDPVSQIHEILDVSQKEIWFVSNGGFDKYDCQTESTPCKNLQTVLDRASDGADIYVTSETLSLDLVNDTVWYTMPFFPQPLTGSCCLINSSLSYTLRSINGTKINITCSSEYYYLLL